MNPWKLRYVNNEIDHDATNHLVMMFLKCIPKATIVSEPVGFSIVVKYSPAGVGSTRARMLDNIVEDGVSIDDLLKSISKKYGYSLETEHDVSNVLNEPMAVKTTFLVRKDTLLQTKITLHSIYRAFTNASVRIKKLIGRWRG